MFYLFYKKRVQLYLLCFSASMIAKNSLGQSLILPNVISSNMILQQNTRVPIWGLSKPGETIEIVASWGKKVKAIANENGKWQTKIPTPTAIAGKAPNYSITIANADTVIHLKNVLIGEVWLCGGQSNMTFQMKHNNVKPNESGVVNYESELATANYPNIHFFTVGKDSAVLPQFNCKGIWTPCSKETAANFSAVAYYFGRELFNNKSVNVPIGLILDAKSGSAIQAWIKHEVLAADSVLSNKYLTTSAKTIETMPSILYNSMLAPIIPFAIKGLIWYQGESNVGDGKIYAKANAAMLKDLRKAWGRQFSFYAVQLTPRLFSSYPKDNGYARAYFREVQSTILLEPKTGIVVTSDLLVNNQELLNSHPHNKKDIGIRLALWALAKDYKLPISPVGPIYKSYTIKGNNAIIRFKRFSMGKGFITKDSSTIKCFKIAGLDNIFYPAQAFINGKFIVVSSPSVSKPIAVRYAFSDGAITNLMNRAGLPVYPFRTDNKDKVSYWEQ